MFGSRKTTLCCFSKLRIRKFSSKKTPNYYSILTASSLCSSHCNLDSWRTKYLWPFNSLFVWLNAVIRTMYFQKSKLRLLKKGWLKYWRIDLRTIGFPTSQPEAKGIAVFVSMKVIREIKWSTKLLLIVALSMNI